jgi:diguanylate cyclase (GGDEF)-like protein/PAS domain S-box-containing protein
MNSMSDQEKIAFLEFIANANTDAIVVKNWQGKFIYANQACATLYNTTPEHMLGHDDGYFTGNQEQADFFLKNVQAIMQSFKPEIVYEDSTDANTGEVRHFLSYKTPFKDNHGAPNILVIAKDITDIKRLKMQAEFNEKRLNYVLETTHEGVWDWDIASGNIFHNQYWYDLTGLDKNQNTFVDFETAIMEEDRGRVKAALAACLEGRSEYRIAFRFCRPDNQVIWIFDRGEIVERDSVGRPTRMIGAAQDITQQKYDEQQIKQLAFYDPLTALPNRRLLHERIELAIHHNQQQHCAAAIMFLDLDNFKMLNDTQGHALGDLLLVEVAQRLAAVMYQENTIARFGGDEFVLVINGLDLDHIIAAKQAYDIAERIHITLTQPFYLTSNASAMHLPNPVEYQLTASIGVIIFNGHNLTEVGDLLKLADLALYRAKTEGRNQTVIFDPSMQQDLWQTQELQNNFRKAITQNQFELFYQPQVNEHRQIIGLEALIRWPIIGQDALPTHIRYISPADFIPMAEETGLILPLGTWVLKNACQQIIHWQQHPILKNMVVSVNVSAKQIWQSHFIDQIRELINQTQLLPTQLKLEITESVLLHDVADTINKLHQLKELGISIALDDFGTGYSSLSYLKRLPVNEIKIDQSFVRDLMSDDSDAIMVKAIVDLSKNFNVGVIAEGVETEEQLKQLLRFGCRQFQGYLFSKPLSCSQLETFVEQHN